MTSRRKRESTLRRKARTAPRSARWRIWLLIGAVISGVGAAVVVASLLRPDPGALKPDPWVRLSTQDVHSLAFPGPDASTMLFGHHGGILRSMDGGRSWAPLPVRQDAMGMSAAADGSIIIAGHEVFQASRDGGATWASIDADLPSLDIHSFARSFIDPVRMWASLAEGGIYESSDGGLRFTKVNDGHVMGLTAIERDGRDSLLGIESLRGLVRSDDGGATWAAVGSPPVAPVTSLTATRDGSVIVLGGADGLFRSDDGGARWREVLSGGPFLAVALWGDGSTIAAVDGDTDFYRSDDGGASWPGLR